VFLKVAPILHRFPEKSGGFVEKQSGRSENEMESKLVHSTRLFARLSLTIFVALFASLSALANGVEGQFRAAGLQIPVRLQQLGYSHFGSLNLNQLINEIQSGDIQIQTVNGWEIAETNGNGRSTARWSRANGRRVIQVNARFWNNSAKDSTALHEFLGVIGFNDSDYALSQHMYLLTLPQAQVLSNVERAEIMRRIEILSRTQFAGTNSSGGGESMTVQGRNFAIERELQAITRSSNRAETREQRFEALTDTLSSNFEIVSTHKSPAQKKAIANELARLKPAQCLVGGGSCRLAPMTSTKALQGCQCPGSSESGTVLLQTN
jgi:hypothetical protein